MLNPDDPPPLDSPEATQAWIQMILLKRPPNAVDRFMALVDKLPRGWDGNSRDLTHRYLFEALGKLGDPKALPLLEAWKDRQPEGEGVQWREPDERKPSRRHYSFDGEIREAIAHIEFLQNMAKAGNDSERGLLCIRDVLRSWSAFDGYPSAGLDLLLKGGDRYVPDITAEIQSQPADQGYQLCVVLREMYRGSDTPKVQQALLDLALHRMDKVGWQACSTLQAKGTPDCLAPLEALWESLRSVESLPDSALSPEQVAQKGTAEAARKAADGIRWRQALAESGGSPSVDILRWALDSPAVAEEAQEKIKGSGNWPIAEIENGIEHMGSTGQYMSEELLRWRLSLPDNREALAATLKIAQHHLNGDYSRPALIEMVGEFGGQAEEEYLRGMAERLTAIGDPQRLGEAHSHDLDRVNDALRALHRRRGSKDR